MKRKIIAYCLEYCPYSNNTKHILEEYLNILNTNNIDKIDIEIVNIKNDNNKIKLKEYYNHNSFPIIIYTSKNLKNYVLGGNDKLKDILNLLEKVNLDNSIKTSKDFKEELKNLNIFSRLTKTEYLFLKWLYYIKLNII